MGFNRKVVDFLINHVVLPVKLPQHEEDPNTEEEGAFLLSKLLLEAIGAFLSECDPQTRQNWKPVHRAIAKLLSLAGGNLQSTATLESTLRHLQPSDAIIFHVKAQNAGLLFFRSHTDSVLVHAFEASPKSGDVMGSSDRLVWSFPGPTISFGSHLLKEKHFVEDITSLVLRMSYEPVEVSMPTTRKANSVVPEERETCHPGLVTEALIPVLHAWGQACKGPEVIKRVRDDVNWDSTRLSWRRSPFWLVIRVGIQIILSYMFAGEQSRCQYKNFMAFFVSKICDFASKNPTDADVRMIIATKAARRLAKLGDEAFSFVEQAVSVAVADVRANLISLWSDVQILDKLPIATLQQTATDNDCALRLDYSHEYLRSISLLKEQKTEPPPTLLPIGPQLDFKIDGLPCLQHFEDAGNRVSLITDFETWIIEHLRSWAEQQNRNELDCASLLREMRTYLDIARVEYQDNPRGLSIMLLTAMELWTALDLICLRLYPLMRRYPPDIPVHLGNSLLLPQLHQLRKLNHIDTYLAERWRDSDAIRPPILGRIAQTSFGVQFYEQSEWHQGLRHDIEEEASQRRARKRSEWTQKSELYRKLVDEASRTAHSYGIDKWGDSFHQSTCISCSLKKQAHALTIEVDEWPLPSEETQAKAAIFELDCPNGFSAWRDATWIIIQHLGRVETVHGNDVHQRLLDYVLLRSHASGHGRIITMGSHTKSFLRSHYERKKFPVSLETITVNNGLRYRLLDQNTDCWVDDQTSPPTFHRHCISLLPMGPYSNLQDFVDSTSCTPNDAIAGQQNCEAGITTHEFLAFASLRAGERIQWQNILRELGSADLSFNTPAVHTLIRQAAIQAGSRSEQTVLREAHAPLGDTSFCDRLLSLLVFHLSNIEVNWKEQCRLASVAMLGLRVFSLGPGGATADRAIQLLRDVRVVALRWCRDISANLHKCDTEELSGRMKAVLLRSALTCRMTFDVDPDRLPMVLTDRCDIASFIESSIYLNENYPMGQSIIPIGMQQSLLVDRKISRTIHTQLIALITSSGAGVTEGIMSAHGLAGLDTHWSFIASTKHRWICGGLRAMPSNVIQSCHYDLLTGELLVEGRRIGRMPQQYTDTVIYQRVFGSRILNVTRSHIPWMEYKTVQPVDDHEIHFTMKDEALLIEAITKGRHLRLVPPEILEPDLPIGMTRNFVHWMDREKNEIEFRPLSSPWETQRQAMKLTFLDHGSSYMEVGDRRLVDHKSQLGEAILGILQALENRHEIVITADPNGVEAEVPRFRLSFTINSDGLLESKQLGATVDPDQNIGCLFGLRNKLVLRSSSVHPSIPQRSVVIPHGSVAVSRSGDHSRVEIRISRAQRLHFIHYQVDKKLSRLRGQSNTADKLFLAYLHAVTSFVLPDPLTAHTGTQEALQILREQSLRTSTPVEADTMSALESIAALTPHREFYPKHLRKMQTVKWNQNLSQLAQHEDFQPLVDDILQHSLQMEMLHEKPGPTLLLKGRGNVHLLRRASNRNQCIRTTGLGTRRRWDQVYIARDAEVNSARALRVYEIASLVRSWPQRIDVIMDLPSRVRQWMRIEGYHQGLEPSGLTCNELLKFPVEQKWGALYDFCRNIDREADQFKLTRVLAMIVFDQQQAVAIVQILLGIAFSGGFADMKPFNRSYDLTVGEKPDRNTVQAVLANHISEPQRRKGEQRNLWQARLAQFRADKKRQAELTASYVIGQWPCDAPDVVQQGHLTVRSGAAKDCKELFTAWNDNRKFMLHIDEVQSKLRMIHSIMTDMPREALPVNPRPSTETTAVALAPKLIDVLHERTPPVLPGSSRPFQRLRPRRSAKYLPGLGELEGILDHMEVAGDATRRYYAQDLRASLTSLREAELPESCDAISVDEDDLLHQRKLLSDRMASALHSTSLSLAPKSSADLVLNDAGLWPRTNAVSMLQCLSTRWRSLIPGSWKEFLISLGELLSSLQRLERLLNLYHQLDIVGFYKEAEEPGHQSWKSADYPDWLLIEIENNLTIRNVQAEVAQKIIKPDGGKNEVLQLNMGEGKSTVIVPMAMAALSDDTHLARLIVLKPLLKQTQNLLAQRLGGLVDRRTFHLPFTRKNRLDSDQISQLREHLVQCLRDQAAVIMLPEHMMSFRLMGHERLQTEPQLGWKMICLERWLVATCRDVLDESDALLDPRFQLVYSVGNQTMMDGQPDRWIFTQRVLALFAEQAQRLQVEGCQSIEVDFRGRCYPFITLLEDEAGTRLLDRVVDQMSCGNLLGLSLSHCTKTVCEAVAEFIRNRSASEHVFTLVSEEFGHTQNWKKLLLLRGLIANNILLFAFQQKRWLVNYGLDASRCLMAVPYRAKGIPSISAEFGHPDVAIVLTCLSYYYSGLSPSQLRQTFENLSRESDAGSEYQLWMRDCPEMPVRSLDGVNLDDNQLWEQSIYPYLRFSKAAADYFMKSVVFPHEGKEFPAKLSTSAWDLPSDVLPSTGFSGTNDNKFLLPLSIQQNDLPQLHRTNAMVASALLQRENRAYIEAKDNNGKRLDSKGLLKLICAQRPSIQVLIDVGAQVLEASNHDVAKEWLRLSPQATAAVFFDASDELLVLDREGFLERFSNSSCQRNMDHCLVYLDEVHTRGVDINMPTYARAAVTLGPRTAKDRLVQACMRMRKLGCHQSLMFFAPPKVHQEILALSDNQRHTGLDSADVLRWCLEQACRGTDSIKPLWIMQGLEHCRRKRLCRQYLEGEDDPDDLPEQNNLLELCSLIQEPEGRPLQEMYGSESNKTTFRSCITDEEAQKASTVRLLLKEWESYKEGIGRDWALQEEQEREIAHEVEQERELQRPPPAKAQRHRLDPLIRHFIQTGKAEVSSTNSLRRAFDSLNSTSAFQHLHVGLVAGTLYATEDFVRTVELTPGSTYNDFIRPVKWVMSSKKDPRLLVIISPYEANALLPEIRKSSASRLHVYAAKTSRAMHPFHELDFYTESSPTEACLVDSLLLCQLSLFAGSLFFEEFSTYRMISDFLAILPYAQTDDQSARVGSDGFVSEQARKLLNWPVHSPFIRSPIVFFNCLVGMRRQGHAYSQTHLGHLLSGRLLTEETFQRL